MAFIYFVVIVSLEPEKIWTLGRRSMAGQIGMVGYPPKYYSLHYLYTKFSNESRNSPIVLPFLFLYIFPYLLSFCFENKLSLLICTFSLFIFCSTRLFFPWLPDFLTLWIQFAILAGHEINWTNTFAFSHHFPLPHWLLACGIGISYLQ